MVTNRKNTRGYRFGGHSLERLEVRIAKCKAKLVDPADPDDKRWLLHWLKAAEQELAKKERSLESNSLAKKVRASRTKED
jgi:hypothetical protein